MLEGTAALDFVPSEGPESAEGGESTLYNHPSCYLGKYVQKRIYLCEWMCGKGVGENELRREILVGSICWRPSRAAFGISCTRMSYCLAL